jgi:hypothetical protein
MRALSDPGRNEILANVIAREAYPSAKIQIKMPQLVVD